MKPDPVSVEIVKDGQAELIAFSVIGLGTLGTRTRAANTSPSPSLLTRQCWTS